VLDPRAASRRRARRHMRRSVKATKEIFRADGSAGWCMGICNAVNTFVHKGAPPKACQEAFGNGPVGC
jgi:hypothetical protein